MKICRYLFKCYAVRYILLIALIFWRFPSIQSLLQVVYSVASSCFECFIENYIFRIIRFRNNLRNYTKLYFFTENIKNNDNIKLIIFFALHKLINFRKLHCNSIFISLTCFTHIIMDVINSFIFISFYFILSKTTLLFSMS